MRWTERQRAMLREMGVHLWAREVTAVKAGVVMASTTTTTTTTITTTTPTPAAVRATPPLAVAPALAARERAPATADAPSLAPADWLVVGEALDPDDAQQEPLLDNMLRAIGVARRASTRERRAAYLALVAPSARDDSAATSNAGALTAAIDAVAPRCIVALGRGAAAALLGSDAPLGHWRGRCHGRGALPVVVTFSLAFLLRHPADKAKAWADLCLAVAACAPVG